MSERLPSLIISDIMNCIEHIEFYTHNANFEKFENNFMMLEACLYNIQIIGEAVSKLPDDVKDSELNIP
jgi:uncharacterized protein with HEPN domain